MYTVELEPDATSIGDSAERAVAVELEEAAPVRTTRSVTGRKQNDQLSTEDPPTEEMMMLDDGCEGAAELDEFEQESTSCFASGLLSEEDGKLQRKNQVWSLSETNRFYQGLKEYGKSFEQLSKFMAKYKVNRDKVQIQKYYFNLFKAFRAIAKITEDELKVVPRDAKELFIVINGCEYKQRTMGSKICPDTFRQLLLNGFATVKLKSRRLVVKTPACKALRQFFKYDEKFANIPRQLTLKLIPSNPADKDYVLSCEQNPFLFIQIDMNDSITNVFDFLKLKWLPKHMNPDKIPSESEFLPDIKLTVPGSSTFPKLIVRNSTEAQRRLSLKNLIQYCEDRIDGVSEDQNDNNNPIIGFASPSSSNHGSVKKKSRVDEIPSSIVVDNSSAADFQFQQELLTSGLTKSNVEKMSGLHLYLIAGMQTELLFQYSIMNLPQPQPSVWDLFVSFVKRDYIWYGTDYMIHGTTHAHRKRKKLRQKKKKEAKEAEEAKIVETTAIVDDEMLGFLEQWNSMSKTSARLHQPEPEPNVSREASQESIAPESPMKEKMCEDPSIPLSNKSPPPSAKPRSLISRKRRAIEQVQDQQSNYQSTVSAPNGPPPTDFSCLHPDQPSASTAYANKTPANEITLLPPPIEGIEGVQTTLFPCLERTIDGASLQRALTDEFSNQIGLMAQQNSVDYCRQFEEFVNYFQSPQKAPRL